ncbi:hypothetical protein BWR18_12620 [Tateyamaria omphalii]|uniref:Uncharacterized protein n=2 Tax=Tateyamaria omphalii TaxID=299262 RepID=A0A1P8MWF5_9RHOB|nr:hypothetical protein BWR18_12620 [Tateyamaria omphalii]
MWISGEIATTRRSATERTGLARSHEMIRIDTKEGPIFAVAEIQGIPINPLQPPFMDHIDPIRRWESQAERVWVRQPWIAETGESREIFYIGPTDTRPKSWGRFATREGAVEYVLNPPLQTAQVKLSDDELNF